MISEQVPRYRKDGGETRLRRDHCCSWDGVCARVCVCLSGVYLCVCDCLSVSLTLRLFSQGAVVPTIFADVPDDAVIMQEEIFGPVGR